MLAKLERYINRAADVLIDAFEGVARDLDDLAKQAKKRLSRKHLSSP
ncbi:MAG: hypothetical protein KIT84_13225 [Labilithrix sp.]|nr:hypothetical protein [Labilithrix sp.]MCW5811978.1 hypothetical protein [Labilithrix sp.]